MEGFTVHFFIFSVKQEVGLSGDIKGRGGRTELRQIGQVWKLNGQGLRAKSQRIAALVYITIDQEFTMHGCSL